MFNRATLLCRKKPAAFLRIAALLLAVPVFNFGLYCMLVDGTEVYWPDVGIYKSSEIYTFKTVVDSGECYYIKQNGIPKRMGKKISLCFLPAILIHAKLTNIKLVGNRYLPALGYYQPEIW